MKQNTKEIGKTIGTGSRQYSRTSDVVTSNKLRQNATQSKK